MRKIIIILFISLVFVSFAAPQEQALKTPKFFIRVNYNVGFSELTNSVSWSKEIYFENASYNIGNEFGKGNSINFGLGFKFSKSLGIELGADLSSRDKNTSYSATIPHPLLFNTLRNSEGTGSFKLTENVVFLNFILSIPFGKFSFDLFGGPAYFFSNAEFINDIQYSDSYPYETININATNKKLENNVLGFNGGASLNFYFAKNFGIFINGHYLSASADFNPGGDIPGWKISLGGFKAGGGLKILF